MTSFSSLEPRVAGLWLTRNGQSPDMPRKRLLIHS